MKSRAYPNSEKVIVSMTSFPRAVDYAVKALGSLLKGNILPDKIVLYLTFSQFGDKGLPEELLELEKKNPILEIRDYPDDIRSYTKLVPALKDFPDAVIVTVDDDIIYPANMLEKLLKTHKKVPDAVVSTRTKLINPDRPYKEWKKFRPRHSLIRRIHKNSLIMQTGVGGVLYPPGSLKEEMLEPSLFLSIAPTADDLWFWAATVANGRMVVPVPFGSSKVNELPKPKEISLKTVNFKEGRDRNYETFDLILKNFPEVREVIKTGYRSRWY